MKYYFDTHAILGLLLDEPRYRQHAKAEGVTHRVNLLEAPVQLVRRKDPDPMNRIRGLGLGLADASDHSIMMAAHLKVQAQKSRNLSTIDAFGYALALQLGLSFLTGDPGFEGMPNVEFVKGP